MGEVDLTLNEYQILASRTMNKKLSKEETQLHALFEICAETGEIHSIFQKTYQGHKIKTDDLKNEIGDLMWGIAELCTVNGWDLEEIALKNVHKLRARYPDGFSEERSLHRDEEDDD